MKQDSGYIRWLEEIKIEDIPIVGGKNASLGEMCRELTSQGVKILEIEKGWFLIS